MEIQDILKQFKDSNGCFPIEALNAAIQHQETMTPYLLSILKDTISNFEAIDEYQMDYIFALYILPNSKKKKHSLYPIH